MKVLVLENTIHDQKVTKHELSSPSGRDRGFRLKSADPPKLRDTMSFGSPRSPNRATSSLCHRTRDCEPPWRFRIALVPPLMRTMGPSGLQRPSTNLGATPRSILWFEVPLLVLSRACMSGGSAEVPPMLCGMWTLLPSQHKRTQCLLPLQSTPEQPKPRTGSVTFL